MGVNLPEGWGGRQPARRMGWASTCQKDGVGVNLPEGWGGRQPTRRMGWVSTYQKDGVGVNLPEGWGGRQPTRRMGWASTCQKDGVGVNLPEGWGGRHLPTLNMRMLPLILERGSNLMGGMIGGLRSRLGFDMGIPKWLSVEALQRISKSKVYSCGVYGRG